MPNAILVLHESDHLTLLILVVRRELGNLHFHLLALDNHFFNPLFGFFRLTTELNGGGDLAFVWTTFTTLGVDLGELRAGSRACIPGVVACIYVGLAVASFFPASTPLVGKLNTFFGVKDNANDFVPVVV